MHNAIVILQANPTRAENLASSSKSVSQAVFIVQSLPELQALVAQFPISVGVVDLGLVPVHEVVRLRLARHGNRLHPPHPRRHHVDRSPGRRRNRLLLRRRRPRHLPRHPAKLSLQSPRVVRKNGCRRLPA